MKTVLVDPLLLAEQIDAALDCLRAEQDAAIAQARAEEREAFRKEHEALGSIRKWLTQGATIKARDPQGKVLEIVDDPHTKLLFIHGGLEVRFPPSFPDHGTYGGGVMAIGDIHIGINEDPVLVAKDAEIARLTADLDDYIKAINKWCLECSKKDEEFNKFLAERDALRTEIAKLQADNARLLAVAEAAEVASKCSALKHCCSQCMRPVHEALAAWFVHTQEL